jgi:hypothetical protein
VRQEGVSDLLIGCIALGLLEDFSCDMESSKSISYQRLRRENPGASCFEPRKHVRMQSILLSELAAKISRDPKIGQTLELLHSHSLVYFFFH